MKQNEADLLLAKKNAEQAKANIDKLTIDLENEKLLNQNLKSQVKFFISFQISYFQVHVIQQLLICQN